MCLDYNDEYHSGLNYQNQKSREFFYEDAPLQTDAYGARVTQAEQAWLTEHVQDYQKKPRGTAAQDKGRLELNENIPGGVHRIRFENSLNDAYAQVAYQRAADLLEAWRDGPHYPMANAAFHRFPGVDPEGKFCSKDMEFAQRLHRIETARFLVSAQDRSALEAGIEALRTPQGELQSLMDKAQMTYRAVREAELAAMLCPDRNTGKLLETGAELMLQNSASITTLDQYFTALEHVAGLRQDAPSKEVMETAEKFHLNPDQAGAAKERNRDSALQINIQDAQKNILYGEAFRALPGWGLTPREVTVHEQTLSDFTEEYYRAVTGNWIDTLYNKQEEERLTPTGINRATMIHIEGRTVAQRMKEEYDQISDTQGTYEDWFVQNAKTKTVEYLSDALRTDKDVQVQIFNALGVLQAPVPLEKVKMPDLGQGAAKLPSRFDGTQLDTTKSLFSQYEPYRKPLQDQERDRLEQALQQRSGEVDQRVYVDQQTDKIYFKDPVLNTYLQIAELRAANDLQGVNTPVDANLYRKYPGVDPMNKYSAMDMQLDQRIQQIRTVAAMSTGVTADYLKDFLHVYDNNRGNVGYLKEQVALASRKVQIYEQGAKVCPDAYVSQCMENFARTQCLENVDFQELSQVITAAEKVAGLNNEPLSESEIQTYNRDLPRGYKLDADTPVGSRATRQAPANVTIDLSGFRNVARQCHNVDPKNWGAGENAPVDDNPSNSLANQNRMAYFGSGAAGNTLNALFSRTESQNYERAEFAPDRGSLVIVDGKTIKERMQEHYNNLLTPGQDFRSWYKQNLNQMSSKMVFAALMQGKPVEAYVPDQKGKLPQQPTTITARGYAPDPAKPVTMSAWERLFSKLGFFKEKTAAMAYQEKAHQEMEDARQRLRDTYEVSVIGAARPGSKPMSEMFFGDYMRRNNIPNMAALNDRQGPGSGYRMDRSAATSACVCMMAANGYHIRDILDPTKLLEEKKAVGEIYLERASMDPNTRQPAADRQHRVGDGRWLGSMFFHGQMALRDQFNKLMEGKDLADPQQYRQLLPLMVCLGDAMYDACQEVQANQTVMAGHTLAAYQTVQQSKPDLSANQVTVESAALSEKMVRASNDIGTFNRYLTQAAASRINLASPLMNEKAGEAMADLLVGEYLIDRFRKEPDQPASDRIPSFSEMTSLKSNLKGNSTLSALGNYMKTGNVDWKENGKLFMSGEFEKSFRLNMTMEQLELRHSRMLLRVNPNQGYRVEESEMAETMYHVKTVEVDPTKLTKKLGIQMTVRTVSQNQPENRNSAQPRTMG